MSVFDRSFDNEMANRDLELEQSFNERKRGWCDRPGKGQTGADAYFQSQIDDLHRCNQELLDKGVI